MSSLVKFNNVTIINSTEGGIIPNSFKRGIIQTNKEFINMPRGDGQFIKVFNKTGTSHSVEIEFNSVEVSNLNSIFTRMQNLADDTNVGTLEIDGISINNCVVENVENGDMEQTFKPSSNYSSDYTMTRIFHISFNLTFRQLI